MFCQKSHSRIFNFNQGTPGVLLKLILVPSQIKYNFVALNSMVIYSTFLVRQCLKYHCCESDLLSKKKTLPAFSLLPVPFFFLNHLSPSNIINPYFPNPSFL